MTILWCAWGRHAYASDGSQFFSQWWMDRYVESLRALGVRVSDGICKEHLIEMTRKMDARYCPDEVEK